MTETSEIQDWLAAKLPAEELAGSVLPTKQPGKGALLDNAIAPAARVLDENHTAVLRAILQRSCWSQTDFRAVAAKAGLMPGACFTALNEWTLDSYADLLLESDQILTINQNLKQNIHV